MTLHSARVRILICLLMGIGPFSANLYAQERTSIPLRVWPAPLYWQMSAAERESVLEPEKNVANITAQPRQAAITAPLMFVGITPCRIMDTRPGHGHVGQFGPPNLVANVTRILNPRAHPGCGIPSTALAYSLNLTAVTLGPLSFLSVWPDGQSNRNVSTLNAPLGGIVANAAIVPAGIGGAIVLFVSDDTDLVIDVNGYYVPPGSLALPAGSATAPSLSFGGDSATGMYSTGAGAISVTSGGVNRLTVRADGDLELHGSLRKSGALFLHNLGGSEASNTAIGLFALEENSFALTYSGFQNTAVGNSALQANTTGLPPGQQGGFKNSAVGSYALRSNTTGSANTAIGAESLVSNTSGLRNTALGVEALLNNLSGNRNTALGSETLFQNKTGSENTFVGFNAGRTSISSSANTGIGAGSLGSISTGDSNIAIGANAGGSLLAGSGNIHIGNVGLPAESGTIRLGTNGTHTRTFAAGIRGIATGAADAVPVMIDSNGQLGTVSSSRRFKRDIENMDESSSGLMRLRPVTFHYKQHRTEAPLEYGLIAEEVSEVFPELVVRSADGRVETVQYHKVNAMLLNEVQKQHRTIEEQTGQIKALEARLAAMETALRNQLPAAGR